MDEEQETCPRCNGKGYILVNDGDDYYDEMECDKCLGTGVIGETVG